MDRHVPLLVFVVGLRKRLVATADNRRTPIRHGSRRNFRVEDGASGAARDTLVADVSHVATGAAADVPRGAIR